MRLSRPTKSSFADGLLELKFPAESRLFFFVRITTNDQIGCIRYAFQRQQIFTS